MEIKGFENNIQTIEKTPNDSISIEKPLKNIDENNQRVDINVLKSRLRDRENIILKKNITILISSLLIVIVAGICVTYL